MDKKDYNQIGKDIRDALQDAVTNMDFSELNRQITESVNDALAEVQGIFQSVPTGSQERHASKADTGESTGQDNAPNNHRQTSHSDHAARAAQAAKAAREARMAQEKMRQMEEEIRRRKEGEPRAKGQARYTKARTGPGNLSRGQRVSSAAIAKRPKGSVSSVLFTVFGSVTLGVAALLGLLFGTMIAAGAMPVTPLLIPLGVVALPLGILGSWMLFRGAGDRGRVERFRKYVECLGQRSYVKISELAAAVGKKEKYVRKDLEKMIELDMFPQGHINHDATMFLLDDETYAQYESMRMEMENRSKALRSETREQRLLRETVERGQAYIQAIRKANDAIPGEEISEKLTRLEHAVNRIYVQIQKTPQKLPELRKFQDHYLPTTLKLVETYQEFDAQPFAGENIKTAKAEIEASLDTINQAFETLFDSLFAETAMDVSADISVLQTLLAQEGLTEGAWKKATEDAEYLDMGKETEKETQPQIRLMP